jgi:hypothetical protein
MTVEDSNEVKTAPTSTLNNTHSSHSYHCVFVIISF